MGGLGATFVADFAATHANPAGLSRSRDVGFTLGFMGAVYGLSMSNAGVQTPVSIDRARATVIGLTLPLPFAGPLRNRIAIGLGFYTPTDVVVRGRILSYDVPQFLVLADRTQSVALQIGAGIDLGYGFRVGGGFGALAAIVGTVLISTDATGRAGSRVDNQLVAAFGPIVGASWDRGPFRVGAVFRGELVGNFVVDITTRDLGINLPVLHIAGIAQYDPWQVAAEVAFVRDGWTLAAGATFKRWSNYPGPREATTTGSVPPPAPNFRDTVVGRAGVERRWEIAGSSIAVRGGYFFEPTPVPDPRPNAFFMDNHRHVFTLGLGVSGRVARTTAAVDVYSQLHVLHPRDVASQALSFGGTMFVLGVNATVTF